MEESNDKTLQMSIALQSVTHQGFLLFPKEVEVELNPQFRGLWDHSRIDKEWECREQEDY